MLLFFLWQDEKKKHTLTDYHRCKSHLCRCIWVPYINLGDYVFLLQDQKIYNKTSNNWEQWFESRIPLLPNVISKPSAESGLDLIVVHEYCMLSVIMMDSNEQETISQIIQTHQDLQNVDFKIPGKVVGLKIPCTPWSKSFISMRVFSTTTKSLSSAFN